MTDDTKADPVGQAVADAVRDGAITGLTDKPKKVSKDNTAKHPKRSPRAAPDADWSPVAVDPDTGMEMHGDLPLGRAARLAALADKGRKTDPDGIVTRDEIAAYTGAKA